MSYTTQIDSLRNEELASMKAVAGDFLVECIFSECCSYRPHSFYVCSTLDRAQDQAFRMIETHACDDTLTMKLDELESGSQHIDLGDCFVRIERINDETLASVVADAHVEAIAEDAERCE